MSKSSSDGSDLGSHELAKMETDFRNELVNNGEYAEAVTTLTDYCDRKLNNLLTMMLSDVLNTRPENPALQMIAFLETFVKNNPDYFYDSKQTLPVMTIVGADGLPQQNRAPRGRRTGVSAECMRAEEIDATPARVIEKSPAEIQEIQAALDANILFRDMDTRQKSTVIAAMRKCIYAKGDKIITQGDEGDTYYVLARGQCDCIIRLPNGQETTVKQYDNEGAFGELALLYGVPRAATIVVTSDVAEAWEVDRETFRKVIMSQAFKQRDRYFDFLRKAPFLDALSNSQISKIADVVEEVHFTKGARIIEEGDITDKCFYMLLHGTCDVYKKFNENVPASLVFSYRNGDYFGELALLSNNARAASIIATSDCTCLRLDRHDFERLLGPVQEVLSDKVATYNKINAEMRKSSDEAAESNKTTVDNN